MMIRNAACLALVLCLGCQAGTAAPEAPTTPSTTQPTTQAALTPETVATIAELEEQLRTDVYWLADEERDGRGLGTEGLEESALYAAQRFNQLGLEPAGEVGYFDVFTLTAGRTLITDATRLSINGDVLELGTDYVPFGWSKPATFAGPVAFAGYSVSSEPRDYDDYADIDVSGKVVIVLRYEPHDEEGGSLFLNDNEQRQMGRKFTRESELFRKARAAERAGAAALLIVNPPMYHDDQPPLQRFGSFGGRQRVGIPVMHIAPDAAEKLLASAELPDLTTLQKKIDSTGKPASQIGKPVEVAGSWQAEEQTAYEKNVVALLPGEGPLADEFIVIGGHYDHIGSGEYGSRTRSNTVHFGADDNASGTATVMALAELLAEEGNPEGRSVFFVLFSAEEIGLIGSRRWVEDLPVEQDQVVAMLNYDMLGRPAERVLQVGGVATSDDFEPLLAEAIPAAGLDWKDTGAAMDGRSDHANFDRVGIPAMFFFGSLHDDYHTERDTPDKLDYDFLARATYASFEIVEALRADDDVAPYRSADQRVANNAEPERQPGSRRVQLGIMPDYGGEDGTGLLVAEVSADTPAHRAKLAEGDRILKLGDHEIGDIMDLQFALEDAEPGQTYPLAVNRDGQQVNLSVTFDQAEVD